MTKEELKRHQYDTWNKYYQKHKSEINARRKKVREDYKNKLSIAEKRLADLENQNKLLGERCNQLLKDKGNLTDQIADIKANCDLAIEGRDIKIKELEQQIEKMKRHCNCKHRDSEGYCEVKRTYLMDLSYDGCDKWELED